MSDFVPDAPNDFEPPDYLVALYVAINGLQRDMAESKIDPRKALIAIGDLEKVAAFVSVYLTKIDG